MPHETDWSNWDASPNLAPPELLAKSPKTWIAAGELDILCQEAESYGTQLKELGVEAEVHIYKGSTHSLLVLDGMLYPHVSSLGGLCLHMYRARYPGFITSPVTNSE